MKPPIAVFGAAGHTAGFVLSELRARGWRPVLSGRGPGQLERVARPGEERHLARLEDPESIARAIEGCAAVLNCAGPFGETAPALIDAAARARIHYLDVTGETLVALATFARERSSVPPGLVVAPCLGFFGALGDLLATAALGEWPAADSISIQVALDGWQPTRGTRLAGARRAGRRVVFIDGRLVVKDGREPPPTGDWTFPAPFGAQPMVGELSTVDLITIARHLSTARLEAALNLAPVRQLSDPSTGGPVASDESGRSAQRFCVEVVVRRGALERRAVVQGRDIYAISAPILVEALERVLDGRCAKWGIITAGEAFEARSFLRALPLTALALP